MTTCPTCNHPIDPPPTDDELRARLTAIRANRDWRKAMAEILVTYQIPPDEIHTMMRRVEAVGQPTLMKGTQ